jgi:hypothetical protein
VVAGFSKGLLTGSSNEMRWNLPLFIKKEAIKAAEAFLIE